MRSSRYNTDDINVAFRTAAAMGEPQDIAFMRENLARVQIDAQGSGSKMSALHRACKNGKLAAACVLLAHGANPEKGDSAEKNAYQYANDSGNAQLIEVLQLYRLGRRAWDIAHALFPESSDNASKQEFDRLSKHLSEAAASDVQAIKDEFIRIGKQYREEAGKSQPVLTDELAESTYLPAVNQFLEYFYSLASIYHIINVSKSENFKKAYCDAIAAGVFCSLFNQECLIERFLIFHRVNNHNHAFIVLNRQPGSDPADPNTWGPKACFVNWTGEVYPVSQRPNDSILNLLRLFNVKVHSNRKPGLDGLIYEDAKAFARQKCAEWAEKINRFPEASMLRGAVAAPAEPGILKP